MKKLTNNKTLVNENLIHTSLTILLFLSFFNLLIFSGNWSGDPEIHVVFAENLLEGYPLQFNKGELTSGNTSQIYLIFISFLMLIFPKIWIPFLMKFFSLFSVLLLVFLVTKQIMKKLELHDLKLFFFILLSFFSYPFIFFQGWLGMENPFFALLYFYIVTLVINDKIFLENNFNFKNTIFFIILFFLFFLRPEIIFLTFSLTIFFLITKKIKFFFLGLIITIATFFIPNLFEYIVGVPLHGAGEIRILLSKMTSYKINLFDVSLFVNIKPFRLVIYYLGFILLIFLFFKKGFLKNYQKLIFLFFCSFTPWSLHVLNVLPNFHFSRYSIYFFFIFILIFIEIIEKFKLIKKFNLFIIIILMSSVFSFLIENFSRNLWTERILNKNQIDYISYKFKDENRKKFSEEICKKINCTNEEKINIGIFEVQVRLLLDNRFIVRSLDGVVDYKLSQFTEEEGVDIIEYIKFRNIKYLLDIRRTYFTEKKFSLHLLEDLVLNEKIEIEGLVFYKIHPDIIKVDYI